MRWVLAGSHELLAPVASVLTFHGVESEVGVASACRGRSCRGKLKSLFIFHLKPLSGKVATPASRTQSKATITQPVWTRASTYVARIDLSDAIPIS